MTLLVVFDLLCSAWASTRSVYWTVAICGIVGVDSCGAVGRDDIPILCSLTSLPVTCDWVNVLRHNYIRYTRKPIHKGVDVEAGI